jgi:EPS-associated MarR family transcriptional regulator
MSSQHTQQLEDLNFRVLRLLQDKPDASQRELADQLGISHGKMNYCLKALIDKGLIKLDNFQNSQHKFKYVYLLTPAGISEKAKLTRRFLRRKLQEYEQLKAEIGDLRQQVPEDDFLAVVEMVSVGASSSRSASKK